MCTTLPTDIFDAKISVMEGTVIIPSNELRRIIRDEIEAAMQNKKTALIDEQKRNKRFYLDEASAYLRMAVPNHSLAPFQNRWYQDRETLDIHPGGTGSIS
ncbi:MAG: hypothetical protein MZV64_20795 [Ignavibacteriales bacterium]|nr:hypothetical protein [Ignavibacteriales bacterium]